LSQNRCGLNVLLVRLEDCKTLAPRQVTSMAAITFNAARTNCHGPQIYSQPPVRSLPGLYLSSSNKIIPDSPEASHLAEVEGSLSAELEGVSGVYLAGLGELWNWYPVAEYYDASGDELGPCALYANALHGIGHNDCSQAARLKPACIQSNRPGLRSNTLDRVCGEDGPEGIRLDPPRRALQEFMRAQQDAGVLLCLCSKNNEEDVIQVFRHHAEMPLRLENFVAYASIGIRNRRTSRHWRAS